ncbi:adenylate/guanylate cyclase domain-containing protein [Nocardioides sp. J9]|uniref:adenylate/guanylate cyclase domain-containing protein n=1 Tax=Nocardioides sp. J9 TaxID=935844 RepID=UPI0011AA2086|nr:adenylate/guanylate cyclase domain-containing protein [Nocardioides sp. J9]
MGLRTIGGWLQEQHVQLHMGRWLLELDDARAEREFTSYDDVRGLAEGRFALYIGIALTLTYAVVDVLVLDELQIDVSLARLAVVLLFAGAVLVTGRAIWVGRHLQVSSVVLLTVVLLMLGTTLGRAADFPTEYLTTSCTVTLFGAIGLLRLRMHAVLVMAGVYTAVCLSLPGALQGVDALARNVAPTLGLAAIAVVIGFSLEKLRRTDYLRQREVEAEQARSDELLHNVLPAPIARRLRTEPGGIADSAPEVSVLFSDIVGFTPVSEALAPEDLVQLLDTMFREFDELCEARGIEKIKTVGDAYMAVAGLPEPDPDHAASLAELALDMQRTLARLSPAWPSPIAMRIGIASGPVVAGVIGRRRFTYDLWGDTVNTASRMESHGRPHRIQVSAATHALLESRYTFSDPQVVDVKGKGPMTTYFLLGSNL